MLNSLHISGYVLIDSLDVEFRPGLNIITGETGAGKSILIGALKMILGGRASTDMIRTGSSKAVIEGHFTVEENAKVHALLVDYSNDDLDHLILRREISSGGSRAFVNDFPVPVGALREIASEIIDLHG
ncbi:MAG: AAA family ATPase, partial [Rhodothermales bacterium]|nr:AAA family ATPase [Rhodothermales bacterium]